MHVTKRVRSIFLGTAVVGAAIAISPWVYSLFYSAGFYAGGH